jgi:hypothetical protein
MWFLETVHLEQMVCFTGLPGDPVLLFHQGAYIKAERHLSLVHQDGRGWPNGAKRIFAVT